MAVYRFSASIIGRAAGRSATAAAAYRAAERIEDERTGEAHDYRRRGGVEYTAILTPENAPEWMKDRAQLWNAVEAAERRKDAQLVREIQLSLPHELKPWQRAELVRDFVRQEFVSRGMVADIAIHRPSRQGDERNYHAHIMLTTRAVTERGFGPKAREWNETKLLEQWRERWADFQNRSLQRAGSSERVDHRSYEARGVDREPEPKLGPTAGKMEQEGKASDKGDERRAVRERNTLREALRKEAEVIDLAVEREKRQRAAEATRQAQEQYRQAAGRREHAGETRATRQARDQTAERAMQDQYRQAGGQREATGERDRGQEQQRADPQRQAREKAYQERRFDTWANGKRADLQSHQLDRDGEMNRRHSVQRENLAHHLRATYGPDRDRTAANLAATEARLERGGFFYRLFGQAARDRDQADAERRTLASIDMRTGEYEGRLEAQQAEERRQQAERERRERQDLEERITKARDRRERDGWSDAWEAERQAGADRANDNSFGGGPQRGRDRSLGPEM